MNKNQCRLLLWAVALGAAVSCVKERVTPQAGAPVELGYMVVSDAMHSRPGAEQASGSTSGLQAAAVPQMPATRALYSQSVPFVSYAWALPEGKSWAKDKATAEPYITAAEISYDATDNRWRDASTTYYWPRTASLTFMAYSPASIPAENIAVDKDGITITQWVLDAATNQDKDIMVADIKEDQTANGALDGYVGVPTLFRHCLAKVTVRACKTETGTSDISIDKISLQNIFTQGDYSSNIWSSQSLVKQIDLEGSSEHLTSDFVELGSVLVIPQHLYKVTTGGATGARNTPALRLTYTQDGTTYSNQNLEFVSRIGSKVWSPGQHIIYNITFGEENVPIEFSATVTEWTTGNESDINIGL